MKYDVLREGTAWRVIRYSKPNYATGTDREHWTILASANGEAAAFAIADALNHADTCTTHELELMARTK